jgi:protein-tyrosine phosphatase
MIDLHCHVLPGVDDGPETIEEAIALVRRAGEDGIAEIAATPHVDWHYPDVDSAHIRTWVHAFQERLNKARVDVRITTGAEVAATRGLALDDAELRRLTLGDGGWLLFECPLSAVLAREFADIARSLIWRGHRLMLAHPERSPVFLRSPELLDELVAEGMLAQVTAGSLAGRYGRDIRKLALQFVRRGVVHVVASDGHNARRPAKIGADLADAGVGSSLEDWLSVDAPAAVLAGTELPPRPAAETPSPRTRLARLARR